MVSVGTRDVTIIGGGVVGLTSAYALSMDGWQVTVLEAGRLGGESSWAGGGILCPVPPWRYDPWVEGAVRTSRQLWSDWIPKLESLSGVACELISSGLLLSGDPESHPLVAEAQTWLKGTIEPYQEGVRADFDARLPHPNWPALLLPEISQVRNPRLMQAMSGALQRLGVRVQPMTPVSSLRQIPEGGTWLECANGQAYAATHVVLAAGAWTDQILVSSGLTPLGIRPKLGQMLLYELPIDALPSHIINVGEGYLIPRGDGKVLLGSTVEDRGYNYAPTQAANEQLMEVAQRIWPALEPWRLQYQWTGFRPGYASDHPMVGALQSGWTGLWVNAGHFRNGLGLAPACAQLLAQAIA